MTFADGFVLGILFASTPLTILFFAMNRGWFQQCQQHGESAHLRNLDVLAEWNKSSDNHYDQMYELAKNFESMASEYNRTFQAIIKPNKVNTHDQNPPV
jgi:hypothetical protein